MKALIPFAALLTLGACDAGNQGSDGAAQSDRVPIEEARSAASADRCDWIDHPQMQPSHRNYFETRGEKCEWTDKDKGLATCNFERRTVGSDDVVGLDTEPGPWTPMEISVKRRNEGIWCIPYTETLR